MSDDRDVTALLSRPAVVAAVLELGVSALQVEDVLVALRRFGPVRVDVTADRRRPYACVLQVAGEDLEIGRGTSVLHAALSCWATTLDSFSAYADKGVAHLERFLVETDDSRGEAG
jgi:hypothetical protein